jgi:hypothetical protein
MLSGALLRFEKINPDIATPASVPWYGELITARWAFEALAVEQFINNRYGRIMYPFDKNMSIADFQRNFWIVEMRNKLDELRRNMGSDNPPNPATLTLLADEIDRENRRQSHVQFSFRDELAVSGVSQRLIDETTAYFDQLARYYTVLHNRTVEQRDNLMREISAINPDSMLFLKSRYNNIGLSNLVRNSAETYRIIEYRNRFLQNFHQIYKDPEQPFIKAHFYAPEKNIFGTPFPTLWVNVAVMWCFNIFFFIALYFRWLPNLLELFTKRK